MVSAELKNALRKATREAREGTQISDADVLQAYADYRRHFASREEDPPVSDTAAMDELLLALWDVIVDRETEGADEPDGDLEDYYSAAFAELEMEERETGPETAPVALAPVQEIDTLSPAPVNERAEEKIDIIDRDASAEGIYQLRIVLDGSYPEIWRRILVPADTPQTQLHHMVQAAMGWRGTEHFQFLPQADRELPSTGEPLLRDLLEETGQQCGYEFDSGATWYHELYLEDTLAAEGSRHYPVCTAGARACPPEDIGGMQEYRRMLAVLNDPSHEDYREMAGWLTQDFNPDAFNIEQANYRLGRHGKVRFEAVV